jgi:putative membrane protein
VPKRSGAIGRREDRRQFRARCRPTTPDFVKESATSDMQVSAHKNAVSLFERYSKSGDNPKLKDWAGKTLPALQHHLDMAQAMNKSRD